MTNPFENVNISLTNNIGIIMQPIIEIAGLTKQFGSFTAVNGISFEVAKGEIFGFLGPNGAGKTTTISMLCTLLRPTAGTARIAGFDIDSRPHDVRRQIGLIFQEPSLDDRLTGRENLRFHGRLYNVSRERFEHRSKELLEMVDLTDRADQPVRTYSGGMKRRLEIARGLLHRPEVLFLDEPTIGLDPQTRRHIWSYLRALRDREGITLMMTTHYIDEAENCDRIAIIDHGDIVSLDTPDALKQQVGGDVVSVCTENNERAARILSESFDVEPRPEDGNRLVMETADGGGLIPKVVDRLSEAEPAITVHDVSLRRPTLEDVFVHYTGHAIRDEQGDQGRENLRQRMRLSR